MHQKSHWDTRKNGRLSQGALRAIHGDPRKTRVSRYAYEAGDEIEGTSRRGEVYVLEGRLTLKSEEGVVLLEAGDVLSFHGGDYSLKVDVTMPAVTVWVWDLSAYF